MFLNKMRYGFYLAVIAFLFLAADACKKEEGGVAPPDNPSGILEKLDEFDLDVTEPSGLSFGPDKQTLLTVSDNTNKVYELDMEGNIIRELAYEGNDLEGVTYVSEKHLIAVVEERKREIVFLDYEHGNEMGRFTIETGGNTDNKGLEGVSFNPNNEAFYMLNEDVPGELIVWNEQYGIIDKTELRFAGDYSGIFADAENALLWIVSDESQALYKCDYNAGVIEEYELEQTKFEGVAVDASNNRIYLVNDGKNTLSVCQIKNNK